MLYLPSGLYGGFTSLVRRFTGGPRKSSGSASKAIPVEV
jgi:hypothetical protein